MLEMTFDTTGEILTCDGCETELPDSDKFPEDYLYHDPHGRDENGYFCDECLPQCGCHGCYNPV